MKTQHNSEMIKRMTGVAMFAALAYVSVVIIRIPNIGGFLTMDFKDVIITIAGMFFGPAVAVILSVIVPFIEFLTVSGTGVYGLIMNVLSSLTFSVVASVIYKYKKDLYGAIIGLCSAAFAVTAIMMLANLVITPFYMNMPTAAVAALIPKLLLPFNLTKAVLNAALTMMLYKPLTAVLKKTNLVSHRKADTEKTEEDKKSAKIRTILIFVISFLIACAAIAVILFVWKGNISFFDIFRSKD